MKVIVVEKIENYANDITFDAQVGTATIAITDKLYQRYITILGVYASADAAREAIENEKMELIEHYGEKALDDENTDDMHTFYGFATDVLELRGTDMQKEVNKNDVCQGTGAESV